MCADTPRELNYRMPAEWHRHAATLLLWPDNRETWPGRRLESVEEVYLNIIEILHRYEPIHLIASNKRVEQRIRRRCSGRDIEPGRIIIHRKPINEVWARDCGPIFIRRDEEEGEQNTFAITDWEYNAWGGKYPPYDDDNRVPEFLAKKYGIRRFCPGMVLEGGAIETNGKGVGITTESVLLNPNRNPDMDRAEIERMLADYLGLEQVIWLESGLAGDDTDGHVDDLTRFLNADTLLTVIAEDPDDVNHDTLARNLEILQETRNQEGRPFGIELLPLPETRIEGTTVDGSKYVPASYANFYIANGVVLVPIYDSQCDRLALELFERYFPERDVFGIPCADLVWGQGSIHCITQQLYGL